MERFIQWKKGIFKRTYELFSGETRAGMLKENTWKDSAGGELNGKKWEFRMKGFWKRRGEITEGENDVVLATITFNNWRTKAFIEFPGRPGRTLTWSYDNFWHTRWSLTDPSGRSVKYHGRSTSGEIRSTLDDDMLILAGLFIESYNKRSSAATVAAAS